MLEVKPLHQQILTFLMMHCCILPCFLTTLGLDNLLNYISDIESWMAGNFLQLNQDEDQRAGTHDTCVKIAALTPSVL